MANEADQKSLSPLPSARGEDSGEGFQWTARESFRGQLPPEKTLTLPSPYKGEATHNQLGWISLYSGWRKIRKSYAKIGNALMRAGYSGTPLPQKLGIKPGLTVVTINAPINYCRLLGTTPEGVTFSDRLKADSSFVHIFVKKRSELEKGLSILRENIADTGTVWVSWPKRSAGVPTDVTEDVVRAVALPLGFVDVKVCAIDEIWSGLKLMVRRTNRKVPDRKVDKLILRRSSS